MNSITGGIAVVLEDEDHHCFVTALPGYSSARLRRVAGDLRSKGYEPLDADEEPDEVLACGTVRIWFKRIVAVGMMAACALFGARVAERVGTMTEAPVIVASISKEAQTTEGG